jgi:hypothetical protein
MEIWKSATVQDVDTAPLSKKATTPACRPVVHGRHLPLFRGHCVVGWGAVFLIHECQSRHLPWLPFFFFTLTDRHDLLGP